jgi:hypothetical protein
LLFSERWICSSASIDANKQKNTTEVDEKFYKIFDGCSFASERQSVICIIPISNQRQQSTKHRRSFSSWAFFLSKNKATIRFWPWQSTELDDLLDDLFLLLEWQSETNGDKQQTCSFKPRKLQSAATFTKHDFMEFKNISELSERLLLVNTQQSLI